MMLGTHMTIAKHLPTTTPLAAGVTSRVGRQTSAGIPDQKSTSANTNAERHLAMNDAR
jgi:hypothetical protein